MKNDTHTHTHTVRENERERGGRWVYIARLVHCGGNAEVCDFHDRSFADENVSALQATRQHASSLPALSLSLASLSLSNTHNLTMKSQLIPPPLSLSNLDVSVYDLLHVKVHEPLQDSGENT